MRAEQKYVQSYLDKLKSAQPLQYDNLVDGSNISLNGPLGGFYAEGLCLAGWDCGDREFLNKVLRSVKDGLGRNIDFALESDRVSIGLTASMMASDADGKYPMEFETTRYEAMSTGGLY